MSRKPKYQKINRKEFEVAKIVKEDGEVKVVIDLPEYDAQITLLKSEDEEGVEDSLKNFLLIANYCYAVGWFAAQGKTFFPSEKVADRILKKKKK